MSEWFIDGQLVEVGITRMSAEDWFQQKGPRGGIFWRNRRSGDVRYQKDNPGGASKSVAPSSESDGYASQSVSRVAKKPMQPKISEAERAAAAEADKAISQPSNNEEWLMFSDAVVEHPYYKRVASLLSEAESQTKSGDVRMWSKERFSENGKYTTERAALHERIIDSMLNKNAKAKPGQKPQVMFIIGPPGAGKTSVGQPITNGIGVEFTTINADDVKSALPEYAGWNAALLHEESSDIAEGALLGRALAENHNILFDLTGASEKKMMKLADEMAARGYDLHLVNVSIPSSKSSYRAWMRFRGNAFGTKDPSKEPGRFVPPSYVHIGVDGNPDRTYERMKNHPAMKSWSMHNNDVPMGEKAILVDKGSR